MRVEAEFRLNVGPKRIMLGQFGSDDAGGRCRHALSLVDGDKFGELSSWVLCELVALFIQQRAL